MSGPAVPTLALDPETVETLAEAIAARVVALASRREEDSWMTSAEAARHLAVPISTLRKWTAAGAVPFSQDVPGGRCYFRRAELDRWRAEGGSGDRRSPIK
ncbi:MAG: helix-turn-helix domain-containing protein [Actinobacteria bacterium]|nr:helix-turn-helix domain-containing protein [Actinomycetota bacterium]